MSDEDRDALAHLCSTTERTSSKAIIVAVKDAARQLGWIPASERERIAKKRKKHGKTTKR